MATAHNSSLKALLVVTIVVLLLLLFDGVRRVDVLKAMAPNMKARKRDTTVGPPVTKSNQKKDFNSQLASYAAKYSVDKTIMISVIDSAYMEMVLNFWESSLVKFEITNYLFICMDEKAKTLLPPQANECLIAKKNVDGGKFSPFGSTQFNRKVMFKTELSLVLLDLGYNVIISDADVVFLQNPMPYFTCVDCDIIIQDNKQDNSEANSGFYMIKPTKPAKELQRQSIERSKRSNNNDQNIMNALLRSMKKTHSIKVVFLDNKRFLPGVTYFNPNDFASDYNCSSCVMVHNNWVVGIRTKTYRFKEMEMWVVDTDGYYTSKDNKYIMYSNPLDSNRNQERAALNLAFKIANSLKRIVILPTFNHAQTKSKRCNLLRAFGKPYLLSLKEPSYRESAFLRHPKVPSSTKLSLSPKVDLKKLGDIAAFKKSPNNLIKTLTANGTLMSYKIIQFETLIL